MPQKKGTKSREPKKEGSKAEPKKSEAKNGGLDGGKMPTGEVSSKAKVK